MNDGTPIVEVFVLSRDRLDFMEESISSCADSKYENFRIIVSDNSTNPIVLEKLKALQLSLNFEIRARANLKFCDHINTVLSEVTAPFFMIFHDDDVMLPNCLSDYVEAMARNVGFAACAGNALIIRNHKFTDQKFFKFKAPVVVNQSSTFVKYYFARRMSHPAFPSYLFRTSKVRGLRIDERQGRGHSDTSFMHKVMNSGGLLWLPGETIRYRMHNSNMSVTIDFRGINSLIKYLLSVAPAERVSLVAYKNLNCIKFYFRYFFLGKRRLKARDLRVLLNAALFFLQHPVVLLEKLFGLIIARRNFT